MTISRSIRLTDYRVALISVALTSVAIVGEACGAEVRLKGACRAPNSVVRLGDIADVDHEDETAREEIADLSLAPAPARGERIEFTAAQIREALALRTDSGSEVVVVGEASVEGGDYKEDRIQKKKARRAVREVRQTSGYEDEQLREETLRSRVEEATRQMLSTKIDPKANWVVELDPAAFEGITVQGDEPLRVAGGGAPWTGSQNLTLYVGKPGAERRRVFRANVSKQFLAVVALRDVKQGEVLSAGDMEKKTIALASYPGDAIDTPEEAAQLETTRPIKAGQVISKSSVRNPVLVRRNDVINLIAVGAGVRIKTQGKAIQEGGWNDVILVQNLDNPKTVRARITGDGEATVFVDSPTVTANANVPSQTMNEVGQASFAGRSPRIELKSPRKAR